MQCRQMRPGDIPRVIELTTLAFASEDERARIAKAVERAYQTHNAMKLEHGFVVEDDGLVIAKGQVLDMRARLGVVTLRVAGLHALVTDPSVSARTLMLPLARYARRYIEDAGFEIGIGFTRHENVFRLFGGATLAAEYTWEVDVSALVRSQAAAAAFRGAVHEDIDRIVALTNSANASRPLSIVRTEALWHELDEKRRANEIWISERSYLGLRSTYDALEVRDIGAEDEGAYDQALHFLATLAHSRGLSFLRGAWPADHGLVRASLPAGARTTRVLHHGSGCMGGPVLVDRFLDAVAPEIARRVETHLPGRQLLLRYTEGAKTHDRHFGQVGASVSLSLSCSPAMLLQLLAGTDDPLVTLATDPRAKVVAEGAPLADVLAALVPAQSPYIAHVDRW
jgi:hypothetical protein